MISHLAASAHGRLWHKADMLGLLVYVRFEGDSVEKGRQESVVIGPDGEPVEAASPIYAVVWAGIGISFAIFRRFWAVAARMNSSLAPFGPRSLRWSSLRIRLR